jgi:hypothetical protein
MTQTTNKGGKTLVVPTPYSVKMALIDACFRAWDGPEAFSSAQRIFDLVKARGIRFRPPPHCVVQNTFVKALDANRDSALPFKQTIIYREHIAFSGGPLEIALDIDGLSNEDVSFIAHLFWHVNSLGKRGGFWQCLETGQLNNLGGAYTVPMQAGEITNIDEYGLIQLLDDFGEALCDAKDGFDRVSTYGQGALTLGKHRVFIPSAVPYRRLTAAKRFTWYERTPSH